MEKWSSHQKSSQKRNWILLAVFVGAVGIGIGVLIGWFSRSVPEGPYLGPDVPSKIIEDADEEVAKLIVQNIQANNIEENLRGWSSYPHLGGTPGEDRLAQELYDRWQDQGMDHVTTTTYDVLLSYPDQNDPSVVSLLNDLGQVIFSSHLTEPILTPEDNHTDIIPPYNAYSPPGEVEGELVYVNYGRVEDFEELRDVLGVNVSGKIVIARYGKIFRADKVSLAYEHGAIGCILYTDPADYSIPDVDPYPNSWWLPETGVQRGTVFPYDGDPLTPAYPSTQYAYRQPIEKAGLPQVPVHPISFGDAEPFLSLMGGQPSPPDWKGALNVSYNLGPGFIDGRENWSVKLKVTSTNRRANTTNVFGFIQGSVEPDRYVLLSNHRDAWVFGAVDPTSGTAVMAEVSRVFMDIVKNKGWRPRRTIVFASWGAEEYGLIGSCEWVEHYVKTLAERTVVVLNVDLALQGQDSIRGLGVPLLYHAMYEVAKKVASPNGGMLYDEWLEHKPGAGPLAGYPHVGSLGSGSDYATFIAFAGIPALDVRYDYGDQWSLSSYPLYHSSYETFYLMEKYLDPGFKYSAAVATYWAEMTRYMSDALVLPMNASMYGESLKSYAVDLENGYGTQMADNGIKLDALHSMIKVFSDRAKAFHERLLDVNLKNPLLVRQYNDQLMLLERAFTDPAGLPLRPLYKHTVFAPSTHDGYAGATFPGLIDLMYRIDERDDSEERWEMVRKHLAAIIFAVESASATLKTETSFTDG